MGRARDIVKKASELVQDPGVKDWLFRDERGSFEHSVEVVLATATDSGTAADIEIALPLALHAVETMLGHLREARTQEQP